MKLTKFAGKKSTRVMVLVMLAAAGLIWALSYVRFTLVAREAYSGIGTELMSVRGKIVFWRYNSYHREPPPQSWMADAFAPDSRMGKRMSVEYDFDEAPHFWQRAGFLVYSSDSDYGPDTHNLVISVPYAAIVALLGLLYLALRRLRTPAGPGQTPTSTSPGGHGSF